MSGWIGVDLDGTLAHYEGWQDGAIGEPVPEMVVRVKRWLAEGREVRIVTARAANGPVAVEAIQRWCAEHLGVVAIHITDRKDFQMVELWDDRVIRVEANTGRVLSIRGPAL